MAIFSRATLIGLLLLSTAEAFQVPVNNNNNKLLSVSRSPCHSKSSKVCLNNLKNPDDGDKGRKSLGLRKLASKLGKRIAFLTPLVFTSSTMLVGYPEVARASAPVMAIPKADTRDPAIDALENHQRKMRAKAQEDLRQFTETARKIEAEQGPDARAKFEADYKANQERLAQERLDRIEKLKYDLLDQGICPFTDLEGQRQLFEAEKGVDLGAVAGTPFYIEKEYENKSPEKSFAYRKAANREIIKCMVQDMKNRDIDPVEYFKTHQDKTSLILDMPVAQATATAAKYKENIELYGQIVPPKEGEISAKERLEMSKPKDESLSKEETKRMQAEAKAKAAAEKAEAKAKAKAEKEAAKAKAKAEKEAAKAEKAAAKAAEQAAKESAKQEKEAAAAAAAAAAVASPDVEEAETPTEEVVEPEDAVEVEAESTAVQETSEKKSPSIPIVPVSAVIVTVGGGYAFKVMRDKAAAKEEERQRQLKLLMGGMSTEAPAPAPALEEVDTDLTFDEEPQTKFVEDTAATQLSKKKKRGFFGKKKNVRETDITELVGEGAKAPEFALLLAKILVFGAPGRFPGIISLPGDMPMEEFDMETASAMLMAAQESANLSKEDAAEIFANVVNCMLIDIVDLASASLKEKDSKVTVEAIGIVVDYMNHAASLYDSIAEGVVITPVTYGGGLSKGKLEQMYSAYAASGMNMANLANLDEGFDDRVSLLRDVFQINEKKAEGLMMKAMQKSMMEMMKSGEGMEGLQDMMKQMGGMEGMGDLAGLAGMGDGDGPDPEQLKVMLTQLKEAKEAGLIPESEMEGVKKQFKEAFGSSIEQVMKEADGSEDDLTEKDKELLELMKSILD